MADKIFYRYDMGIMLKSQRQYDGLEDLKAIPAKETETTNGLNSEAELE